MRRRRSQYAASPEQRLGEILSSEGFDEDSTWQHFDSEWELFYHLSPLRRNLLSWVNWKRQGMRVLELGAGCGAMTLYFAGLNNVSGIVAVEKNERRVDLIEKRCGQTDKVEVVHGDITEYASEEKFDVVALIGVLEYAGMSLTAEKPYLHMLAHASSFLDDDGVLVLAIENQLGYKYLAGIYEDHYGWPYEGLANYPHDRGIRTFDKATVEGMLRNVGLPLQHWCYPCPDYKLPKTILFDSSFSDSGFDWLPLVDFPTRNYAHRENAALFAEKELLKSMSKNVDISFLMNSFLVFAARESPPPMQDDGLLAVKLNSARDPKYRTTKRFRRTGPHKILVEVQKSGLTQGPDVQIYHAGYKNLCSEIVDAVYGHDFNRASKCFRAWYDLVRARTIEGDHSHGFSQFCREKLAGTPIYGDSHSWLASHDVDLILDNVLWHEETGDLRLIDLEWQLPEIPIPLQLVLDRGMYCLLQKLAAVCRTPMIAADSGKWNMPDTVLAALPLELRAPELFPLLLFEKWFQATVLVRGSLLSRRDISAVDKEVRCHRRSLIRHIVYDKVLLRCLRRAGTYRLARQIARAVLGRSIGCTFWQSTGRIAGQLQG